MLWLLFAHYVLDYPLQGEFLATTKGKNIYSLFAHSMIYGLGMCLTLELLGAFSLWKAPILVISHMVIDYIKANSKDKSNEAQTMYLYADQAAHIMINTVLYMI